MTPSFAELADAYVDGALDEPQAERLLGYLSDSPGALRHLRALAVIDLDLRAMAGNEDDNATAFRRQILARIHANRSGRHFRAEVERRITAGKVRPRRRRLRLAGVPAWLVPATVAALVAVVVLISGPWRATKPAIVTTTGVALATLTAVQGWVTVEHGGEQRTVALGDALLSGDVVVTAPGAQAEVRLADGTLLRLEPGGGLRLAPDDGARACLERGRVEAVVTPQRPDAPAILSTNAVSVRVLGTRFVLASESSLTDLQVSEGRVTLRTTAGTTAGKEWLVTAGQTLRLRDGRAERTTPIDLRPSNDTTWQRANARTLVDLVSFRAPAIPLPESRWGGRGDLTLAATGGFRVELHAHRWWTVDPDGHPLFLVGIGEVGHHAGLNDTALRQRFGGVAGWADAATTLLRDHSFNTIGGESAFAQLSAAQQRLAIPALAVVSHDVARDFAAAYLRTRPRLQALANSRDLVQFLAPLLPGFDAHVQAWGKTLAEQVRLTNVAGVMTERQSVTDITFDWQRLYDASECDGTVRSALDAWMNAGGHSWTTVAAPELQALRDTCLAGYRDHVFPTARRNAPGALLLGQSIGLHAVGRAELRDTLIAPVDVLATYLVGRWLEDTSLLTDATMKTGKPLWIDYVFAKAADSGLPNLGNGFTVRTQAERARFYQHTVLTLVQSRVVIGWEWFRFEDVGETSPFGINSNKGLIDREFTPYRVLLDAMAEVHRQRYALADYFDVAK